MFQSQGMHSVSKLGVNFSTNLFVRDTWISIIMTIYDNVLNFLWINSFIFANMVYLHKK